jgi:hypothetical protein
VIYFQYCSYEISNGYSALAAYLNSLASSTCYSLYNPCCLSLELPVTSSIIPCGYDTSCYTDTSAITTEADCESYIYTEILNFLATYYTCTSASTSTTTSMTTTAPSYLEDVLMAIRNTAPLATAVAGSAVVFVRPLPLVNENGIPPGNPRPGTPGGGSFPTTNSDTSQQALALVPAGTIPVAIFPPDARPRTRPAVSVIFAENPRMISINNVLVRLRRSLTRNSQRRGMKKNLLNLQTLLERSQYVMRLFLFSVYYVFLCIFVIIYFVFVFFRGNTF